MKTCMDVMTANPICCTPDETVATAAQLMKLENIGSIPVVQNHQNKMLVGIVTDRDLAMEVIAENRDPNRTNIRDVMHTSPHSCDMSDNVEDALRTMSKFQVRRIPVVDEDQRLVGIIAQGDIATRLRDDERTGEVVEEISKN